MDFAKAFDKVSHSRLLLKLNHYCVKAGQNKPKNKNDTSSTLLDHIWTSNPEYIKQSGVVKTGISDHYMVYAVHQHKTNHQQGDQQHLTIQYRSFKNFDQDAYEIVCYIVPVSLLSTQRDGPL